MLKIPPWFHQTTPVFVYGTLLWNRSNHLLLEGATTLGDGTLSGYALRDLGAYPAAVGSPGDSIRGQVYLVDEGMLRALDRLEGEGSLYHRRTCTVNLSSGHDLEVQVYIFGQGMSLSDYPLVPLDRQPWGRSAGKEDLIWYAAYGSNLLEERLRCYLEGRAFDKAFLAATRGYAPSRQITKGYVFHGQLYYGEHARKWMDQGVAFLDLMSPGFTLGRVYLLHREEYRKVLLGENGGRRPVVGNGWYDLEADLGTLDGIPVRTITSSRRHVQNDPATLYEEVIAQGLREAHPSLGEEGIRTYLLERRAAHGR